MKSIFFFAFIGSPSLVLAEKPFIFPVPFPTFRWSNYTSHTKVQASKDVSSIFNHDPLGAAEELISLVIPNATYRLAGGNYTSLDNVTHLYFRQIEDFLGVRFENEDCDFNVNVKDGKIFSYGETFEGSENSTLSSSSPVAKRDSPDPFPALKRALETHGLNISMEQVQPVENKGVFVFEGVEGVVNPPSAQIVLRAKQGGGRAPAWKVKTYDRSGFLATFLDVETLQVIDVTDYSSHLTATFHVFPWGLQDPTAGEREVVTDPWHPDASPSTWIRQENGNYRTQGNGAAAGKKRAGQTFERYAESPNATFDYPFALNASHQDNENAALTQAFYTVSKYQDLLYLLGFDEQAGNFQKDNYGKGGRGRDPVMIEPQVDTIKYDDGEKPVYNNAYFLAGSDGIFGLMILPLFNHTMPTRDSAFATEVVLHEYTHGLSKRLAGGPENADCVSATLESGGMGEGWSDFMAAAVLTKTTDDRSKNSTVGAWLAGNDAGLRIRPYSTNLSVNELRYQDTTKMKEIHEIGVVWGVALYDMMWNLIEKHPMADKDYPEFDARGVPTDGRYLAMKLVMGGLALQACTVSMVDGRDTILDADVALTGGENQCEIWTAFAKRGLGHGAKHTEFGNEGDDKVPPNFMYTGDYDDPDDACLGAGKVEIETATPMKSKVEIGSSTRPPVQWPRESAPPCALFEHMRVNSIGDYYGVAGLVSLAEWQDQAPSSGSRQ
ncbi:hypothetical protein G6O67_000430 [Ophiocordyceps sinensis]|uniref:Extracellular metalloproteinase n=1 Tax=Ophiocordyceps sinensis TaxID=72228 RepID=A0A8H4PZ82_9HYPO|nr:hypothetical protein G6O67_000430 [Ophiocordyceps sinensis]